MANLLSRGSGKGSGPVYLRPKSGSASSSVCQKCHNWGLDVRDRRAKVPELKVDFYDIAESAELEECCYCHAIYNSIMLVNGKIDLDGYHTLTLSARKGWPFYVSWDDSDDGRVCAEVYRPLEEIESPCLLDGLGSADTIEHDASSDVLFSKAMHWFYDCLTNHSVCQQVTIAAPKRLLFIGSFPEDAVRLIEDVPKDVQFIALSHCWGTNTFRTTQSNLPERMRNIPWDELPKTFQDAIVVSRLFDVRYLWIDSLCIIQDDREDWASESARMGAIYGGAHLTIAVASAADDNEGFLSVTDGRKQYKSHELDLFPFAQRSRVLARRVHDVRTLKQVDPLNLRGWTFQERLLPRRLLTYSQFAVTFECSTGSHCECGSGLRPDPFLRIRSKFEESLHSNRFGETRREVLRDIVSRSNADTQTYDDWYFQIVIPFMNRNLSRPTDILPAISALAEKFQTVLADNYLAGLWEADIKRGLFWRVHRSVANPTAEYRAPSWSWASVEGTIEYFFLAGARVINRSPDDIEDVYCLKVHGVQCTKLSSAIAFGEVSAGNLLVSGQAWPAQLEIEPSAYGFSWSFSDGKKNISDANAIVHFDTRLAQEFLLGSTREVTVVRAPRAQKATPVSAPVLILLCAETYSKGSPRQLLMRFALVLARVTTDEDVYRRIGIMSVIIGLNGFLDQESEEKMVEII